MSEFNKFEEYKLFVEDTARLSVLELALIGRDEKMAMSVLAKVLVNAKAAWMVKTTVDNLDMLKDLRKDKEDTTTLSEIVAELRKRENELKGEIGVVPITLSIVPIEECHKFFHRPDVVCYRGCLV